MPRAVAEAGLACAVLPPDKLARRIAARGGRRRMQVSDSSSRILAGLLEARTGQQLTMSRRWRIETALCVAAARARHRHARRADHHPRHGPASRRSPTRSSRRCSTTRPISSATARRSTCSRAHALPALAKRARRQEAARASGRRAARPARKPIRWRCCSPRTRRNWQGWTIDILGTDVSSAVDRSRAQRHLHPVRGPARASASPR